MFLKAASNTLDALLWVVCGTKYQIQVNENEH